MTPHPLKPGDRVTTPTGQAGRIVRPPWLMPHHHLIALDDGSLLWLLREILTLEAVVVSPPTRQRKAKASQARVLAELRL